MKILLATVENTLVCLGLRQVAASLKRAGHDVYSLFLPKEFNDPETHSELEHILQFIISMKPELIGFSLMSSHFLRTRTICLYLKQHLPSVPIVCGGIHPTLAPDSCLEFADYVVIGEGEQTLPLLINVLHQNPLPPIPGIWAKTSTGIIKNDPGSRIENLDSLPLPDYELSTQFILSQGNITPASNEVMRQFVPGIMDTHYITSTRGCPHACTYCCNSALRRIASGEYLRRRSVAHFIEEMEHAKKTFSYLKGFVFMDDSFLYGDPAWFEDFCAEYKKRIDMPFLCWANPVAVREDIISMLVKVGLVGVHVGLESGSETIARSIYKRPGTNEVFHKCMDILHKYRKSIVDIRIDVITDNPYETEENTIETIRAIAKVKKPFFLGIVSLLFYPMTELTERAISEGILTDKGIHIFHREFFHYRPTYLNRLMRTLPISSPTIVEYFIRHRSTLYGKLFFYMYYFGYFISIRRQLKALKRKFLLFLFKHFESMFSPRTVVTTRIALIDF